MSAQKYHFHISISEHQIQQNEAIALARYNFISEYKQISYLAVKCFKKENSIATPPSRHHHHHAKSERQEKLCIGNNMYMYKCTLYTCVEIRARSAASTPTHPFAHTGVQHKYYTPIKTKLGYFNET